MNDNLPNEVKWRGSTYVLETVENGLVKWFNPVSRHSETCSVESWKSGEPYERQMGAY